MKILHNRHVLRHGYLPALLSALLSACGGGGGGAQVPPTVGGQVQGFRPNTTLSLGINGFVENFSSQSYSVPLNFKFSQSFNSGDSYSVTVERHPQGQICAVTSRATGYIQSSDVTGVQVECHDTLLNDTGISRAADGSLLLPDAGDGRDDQASRLTKVGAGVLGFDFTKICSSGDVVFSDSCPITPAFPQNIWSCTRDNVTGLVWSRDSHASDVSAPALLCGKTGWRRPTTHELLSIVHAGKPSGTAIDTDYFSAQPSVFLATDSYVDGTAGKVWGVDFGNLGAASGITPAAAAAASARVRWITGTAMLNDPSPAVQSYQRTPIGTDFVLVDTRRELMWLIPQNPALKTWDDAVASVAGINSVQPGGYGDWRLPDRNELDSLVLRSAKNPALDAGFYGDNATTFSQSFWTGSPYVVDSRLAWGIDFSYGDISPYTKSTSARVIYVRARVFNTP
jgi:hypothetical protein